MPHLQATLYVVEARAQQEHPVVNSKFGTISMSAKAAPSTAAPASGAVPPSTFVKHTTTSAAPLHAFMDTTVPAINPGEPIELDSTPVSPVVQKDGLRTRSSGIVTTLGADEATYDELTGAATTNESVRQVRPG